MSRRLGQEIPDDAPDDTKKRNLRWLPLGITLFRDLQRTIHVALDEIKLTVGMQSTYKIAITSVWADETRKCNHLAVSEEIADFADAANVLCTILC